MRFTIGCFRVVLMALSISAYCAEASTNSIARLNQFQLFYTNWARQYFYVKGTISTNLVALNKHGEIVDRSGLATSQEYKAAEEKHKQMWKTIEPWFEKYQSLIKVRLEYELKNPNAVRYAPTIPGWKDYPKPASRD